MLNTHANHIHIHTLYAYTYTYRSINPNSGDTGGLLLDDWTTPNTGKLSAMALAQPTPSVFTSAITTTSMCINYGAFASSACGTSTTTSTASTPSTPSVVITAPAPAPVPLVVQAPAPVPAVVALVVTPPAAVTGCSGAW
jgi:endoglucanase